MKHTYLYVKSEHYQKYIENVGSNRLDKWIKILPPPSKATLFGAIQEAFEGIETDYNIIQNGNNYLIKFKTNSGTEYRFDIWNEPNTTIYDLAFSLAKNEPNDINKYEELTDKKESIELLSRLVWILKDVKPKLNVSEFCIGATNLTSKDNIYKNLMKFAKSWQKKYTKKYTPSNWALYFKL
jgi:hypothetical protein